MADNPQAKGNQQPESRRPELTRDDAARIAAQAINAVLEELGIFHKVAGIAVFPGGEDVFKVDIVMRNEVTGQTWSFILTVPPPKAASEQRE